MDKEFIFDLILTLTKNGIKTCNFKELRREYCSQSCLESPFPVIAAKSFKELPNVLDELRNDKKIDFDPPSDEDPLGFGLVNITVLREQLHQDRLTHPDNFE
ncbi:hypothetical protein [Halodesulfovibrio sp. MK-HDV]|uniref:hypothetical protein n=1 Tax=Halodesulfovibrio sp. MK-HDV TaxID=2599925 RepID=UPI00136FEF62|nr:hypothetical protein [Halodesulfovibrio sp. MK-HDV]KAF1073453.1 hypothetical protein MKHDV_03586 [Halodesulfovibrio sp. MK-HDV]